MAAIKIRAKAKGDTATVKALMSHPMQPRGQKNKKTGEEIPPHYITEVVAKHNDSVVLTAQWSGSISKNPYISFKFKGAGKGDKISLTWTDNNDKSESVDSKIK